MQQPFPPIIPNYYIFDINIDQMLSLVLFTQFACAAVAADINLLAVGDWGGIPFPPYSTPAQRGVASGMGVVGERIGATAVLGLGDNFYFSGIRGDETADRFEQTWNSVYTAPSLQVPWYNIAGNHDHYGNVTAEIEYTNSQPLENNHRWYFPSLYYKESFNATAIDGKVLSLDVIFIDTIDLSGNNENLSEDDPHYYDALPPRARSDAEEQWKWIEQQLAASTADHVIVAGHYPVYSVCSHGNTQNLIDNLKPMLEQYGAHYIAGHDHCLVASADEKNMNYLVIGAGNTCCTKDDHLDDVPADVLKWYISNKSQHLHGISGGFASIAVDSSGIVFAFYDQDGNVLHETTSSPARAGAGLRVAKK